MSTFVLFDFANLIHRCKHVSNTEIDDTINFAIHITLNSFKQAFQKFNADHVVVALEGRSWRKDIFPEYKAQRKIKDALKSEKEIIDDKKYFKAMDEFAEFLENKTNVTVLRNSKAEADDMIARWIQLHPEDTHIICSSDGDYYQLLSDNVKIFNAMQSLTITIDGVYDDKGKPAKKDKKSTITTKTGNKKVIKEKIEIETPNPKYELFKKIVRGDISDNIPSSYPKVREKGTQKKPGIIEAFDDLDRKGYNYNSFMLATWEKVTGFNEKDEPILESVTVKDAFKFNQKLIDLTLQPDNVKESMDETILQATDKKPSKRLLLDFMQLLGRHELNDISKHPEAYIDILNKGYTNG